MNINEEPGCRAQLRDPRRHHLPRGADDQSAIADAYRVSAIPAHFFVDKNGVLRQVWQGTVSEAAINTSMQGLVTP